MKLVVSAAAARASAAPAGVRAGAVMAFASSAASVYDIPEIVAPVAAEHSAAADTAVSASVVASTAAFSAFVLPLATGAVFCYSYCCW